MARVLVRLYPASWRRRYGDEMEALLEDCQMDIRFLLDTVGGAVAARARVTGATVARSVVALAAATVCAVLVQINLLLALQLASALLDHPLQYRVAAGPVELWAAGGSLWVQFGNGVALLALAVGLLVAGFVAGRADRSWPAGA